MGQESTETISELKICKHSKWYVEHLFAEFSITYLNIAYVTCLSQEV